MPKKKNIDPSRATIQLRPETRILLEQICDDRGWSFSEAAERIVNKYLFGEEKPSDGPKKNTRGLPCTT